MKVLRNIFIFFIVLIVLIVIGLTVFLKNFDVNQYKDQITSAAKTQLGRAVTIGKISLNFSMINGVFMEVREATIAEDPKFGSGDFATLGALKLNVDVMTLITKREILVSKIVIDSPKIKIIRDAFGQINAQTMGPAANPSSGSDVSTAAGESSAALNASKPADMPKLLVQSLQLVNGEVVFIDQSQKPPMEITISKMEGEVSRFSLNESFPYNLQMAVLSAPPNIFIKGTAQLDLNKLEVSLGSIDITTDLSTISLKSLVSAIPALEQAGLKEKLEGKVNVLIPSLTAGPSGMSSLNLSGKMQGGKIMTSLLPGAVEDLSADFSADAKDFTANRFSLRIGTGKINGQAKIVDYMKELGLNLNATVEGLPLESIVGNLPEDMKVSGLLNADLVLTGNHLANPDEFMNSLNGTGQFNVVEGKILNLNFLKMVLSRIKFIPGLETLVQANMPEKYRGTYEKNVTIFQKMESPIKISNGVFDLPQLDLVSELFEGRFAISANVKAFGKFAGAIMLPKDLSDYLASEAEPVQYLRNDEGKVYIAFMPYEGDLTKMKPMPDVKDLAKTAIKEEGKKQINTLLEKVLPKQESAPDGEGTAEPTPESQLINGVLNKIFK